MSSLLNADDLDAAQELLHTSGCTDGLPVIVPVTEFRDTIGTGLTNIVGGADPATEMKKATAAFQPVLDKSNET